MQDPIQTSPDYVDDFRKRHLPSQSPIEAPTTKQPETATSIVGGFLQRTIRKLQSGHTECNYEISELETYESNLNNVLTGLVADKQQLISKLNGVALPDKPRHILNSDEELVSQLQADNMKLREALKQKFDNQLRNNQPELVVNTSDNFEDIMPDRKVEQIKLLQQSLLDAQERLKRYYMKVSPQELAQLDRENVMLKEQVLRLATDRQNDPAAQVGQYPARMYPELKEKNRLLIDLIQRKSPYLTELKQRADGLDSSQMVYDLQNRHYQFELAKMDKQYNPPNLEYDRNKLRIRHAQLEAEYLRLQELLKAGGRIQQEARLYNLAMVGRPYPN